MSGWIQAPMQQNTNVEGTNYANYIGLSPLDSKIFCRACSMELKDYIFISFFPKMVIISDFVLIRPFVTFIKKNYRIFALDIDAKYDPIDIF